MDVLVDAQLVGVVVTLTVSDSNSCENQDMLILYCPFTGIEEASNSTAWFDAYPNPAATELTLRMKQGFREPIELTFIDMQGHIVKRESRSNGWDEGQEIRIDLSALPTGSYQLQMSGSTIRANHTILRME